MSETMDKIKYLDFSGLKKYDELIKSYIASENEAVSDAAASAVASVIDGAPESFDTLKEIAAWIANNDHASDVSSLLIDVAALKAIDHNAYIAADTELENSLKGYVDDHLELKQDIISDLGEIRSGAAAGATALQANDIADLATTNYVDGKVAALVNGAPETLDTLDELAAALKDNADIVTVLTDSIGKKQDTISDLETIRSGAAAGATALQSVPAEYVTETELEGKGYLTANDLTFAEDGDIDALFATPL